MLPAFAALHCCFTTPCGHFVYWRSPQPLSLASTVGLLWGRAFRSLWSGRFTAFAVTLNWLRCSRLVTFITRPSQLAPLLDLPFRKEVIQPHLPVRLPCYDFVPVIRPTLGSSLLAVESPTSGVSNSHDVTGGVYKARERIQRSIADLRLLATPASCRRVAAYNLNYEQL
jgi:hypothetical protein